jgi:sialate O-acetylesterase
MFCFQVCCKGNSFLNAALCILSAVSSKSGLTITLPVPSECVGKQLLGIRYLWRETPCIFKQAAIYSGTDANLPSPPYINVF